MNDGGWIGLGMFLLGCAVFLVGVYVKAGPEWAAIFGGGALAYAGCIIAKDNI